MLTKQEKNIVNINPYRYDGEAGSPRRAPRNQPDMSGEIDTEYYDERVNPRNSIIIDLIHYYVLTQGAYPNVGKEFLKIGPFSRESWQAAGNEGEPPIWFNTITPTDAHAYASLYPQNVFLEQNEVLFTGDITKNPDSLIFVTTPSREARETVYFLNLEDQPANTNTTRFAQFPEGQKNLGKGEEWLAFQRKKKADINCRIEIFEEDEEDNTEEVQALRNRVQEIDEMIEQYEVNRLSDATKRLSSVNNRLTPEYIQFLISLIPEEERPSAENINNIEDSEVISDISQRINLETDLLDWWKNLDSGGMKKSVYFNPIDSEDAFSSGKYYYIHNTGVIDPRAFDRGLRDNDPAVEANFVNAKRKGVEEILQNLNKKTEQNINNILDQDGVTLETKKDTRPGTPWKYVVKIPLDLLQDLPLSSNTAETNLISAHRAALRQKQFNDAASHRVSYKISKLEEKSIIISNSLAKYNTQLLIEGILVRGVSLREQSVKVRGLPALIDRLLLLNNLASTEKDFDAIEILFAQDYQMIGFYYNGSFYTKGIGVGDYLTIKDEDVQEILGEDNEVEPCDVASSTPPKSRGTYNVFSNYSITTNGFILYGNEIVRKEKSQRQPMPWSEFINSYVVPAPEIIPSTIDNINLNNLEDFLSDLDSKLQKSSEEVINLNNILTLGPPNLGASAASVIANARKLAFDSIEDGNLKCENIQDITKEIISFLIGTIATNPTQFWQIPPEKILAIAFRIAYNEIFKSIQEYIAEQSRSQSENPECVQEAISGLSPAAAAMFGQMSRAAITQGGTIQADAVIRLTTKIVEDQMECLLGGIGNNILLNIQNKPGGPWKQAGIEGYKILEKSRPKLTLEKITSPSDFFKTWGKKLIRLLVAAIIQLLITELSARIQKVLACKEPINIDKFESAYPGLGIPNFFDAESYGEADLNNILENSGIDDFVKIMKNHITGENSQLPTQEQAIEFHDDVSKMTTARELNGLLNGVYFPGDRLILDIYGMVYGKQNNNIEGQSLESGDLVYSSLDISPDNITSYLAALGDLVPKSEKDKAFQPNRLVEDSECIPAGQTSYDILRDAGFSSEEIAAQVNENLCGSLEKLNNFCERNDPNELESHFGNYLRSLIGETTPKWIRFLLAELTDIQDQARKVLARIVTEQVDYNPPGLRDIVLPQQNEDGEPEGGANYEGRTFKELGLDFDTDRNLFVMNNLELDVDVEGSVKITDTNVNRVLVSLTRDVKNLKFFRTQQTKYTYNIPEDLLPGTPVDVGNIPGWRQNFRTYKRINGVLSPGELIREYYFKQTRLLLPAGEGPSIEVSNNVPIGTVLDDFYITDPGAGRKSMVWETLIAHLIQPDSLDPCLDGDTIARADTAVEVIRTRIVSYLLNIAPWFNRYSFGSTMSKVIHSEYLYNKITRELEDEGLLRKVLESCDDIAKVFTTFDDIGGLERNTEKLKAVIYRLYSESLRKVSIVIPDLASVNGEQRELIGSLDINESAFNRYSNVNSRSPFSVLHVALLQAGAEWDVQNGRFTLPEDFGDTLGILITKIVRALNHILPIDAIIALQMIYLDRYYNHIELVPEFSFLTERRIKEVDDAFRIAIDRNYVPKFVPAFNEFPKLIGGDNYFRREDIKDALLFRLLYVQNTVETLRNKLDSDVIRGQIDADIIFEEREIAYFRVDDGNNFSNAVYDLVSRDSDDEHPTGGSIYDVIYGRGEPDYDDHVAARANAGAFIYCPHEGYFGGTDDWPRWNTYFTAISSGFPANPERPPTDVLEGKTRFESGDTVRQNLMTYKYYDGTDHKRRDSFGFMLLEFLKRYETPGTELNNREESWFQYYSNREDSLIAAARVLYFVTSTTDQGFGLDTPKPFTTDGLNFWGEILNNIANLADPKAQATITGIATARQNLDAIQTELDRKIAAIRTAGVIEEQETLSANSIRGNNQKNQLTERLSSETTRIETNLRNAQEYPIVQFNIRTGDRTNATKASTRKRLQRFNEDFEEFLGQSNDFLTEISTLIQAYIDSEG